MTENTNFKTALNKSMALCARREMCKADIRQKLLTWSIEHNDIVKIISQLTAEKFIDEERYVIAFAQDKFRHNRWGKVKIASALRMKKIPDDLIRTSLDSIDEKEYAELIKSLLFNHRRSVKAKNQYDLKGKLLRYGLSKGFESHMLYDILNELNEY